MSSIPYPDEKLLFIHEKLDLFRLQIAAWWVYKLNPVLGGSSLQGGPPVSVLAMTFACHGKYILIKGFSPYSIWKKKIFFFLLKAEEKKEQKFFNENKNA
jgi:hypothetical protein